MRTPWGELSDLDVSDTRIAAEILAADKHQLIEGLVVECLFDQIVSALPARAGVPLTPVDVESIIVDTRRSKERWIVFVWARTRGPGLGRYLRALEKQAVPYLLELVNGEFLVSRVENGAKLGHSEILSDLMHRLSGRRYAPFEVASSVRDSKRQLQAFWGFISGYYQHRIGEQVVLPRLLINCGIQPYFKAVWNLDRVFVADDQVWMFEVKHKYPMDQGELRFGINEGELGVFAMLAEAGIRCLHIILVKPQWSKEVGAMYLLNDLAARTRVAVIGAELDKQRIGRIKRGQTGRSAAHTSITGSSQLTFRPFAAAELSRLGVLSDAPEAIAEKIAALLLKGDAGQLSDSWLRELRMPVRL